MAKQVSRVEPVTTERARLHVLQLWFGWVIVILSLMNILFDGQKLVVNLNWLNLSILLLGLLEVVSGRRR